jgi:hypothetical protein
MIEGANQKKKYMRETPNHKKTKDQENQEIRNMKTIIGSCLLVKSFEEGSL